MDGAQAGTEPGDRKNEEISAAEAEGKDRSGSKNTGSKSEHASLKDQTDLYFKLSDKIDTYWRMFMWMNLAVIVALGTTFVANTAVKLGILAYYFVFLGLNFVAVRAAYSGLIAFSNDLTHFLASVPDTEKAERPQIYSWLRKLKFEGRLRVVNCIFLYSLMVTIALMFLTPKSSPMNTFIAMTWPEFFQSIAGMHH